MELLIHASAPSSRKDDERFKRQAQTYLAFESAQHVDFRVPEYSSPAAVDLGVFVEKHGTEDDAMVEGWALPGFMDDTQLARTALESQLATSSLQQGFCAFEPDMDQPSGQDIHRQPEPNMSQSANEASHQPLEHGLGSAVQHDVKDFRGASAPSTGVGKRRRSESDGRISEHRPSSLPSPFVPMQQGGEWVVGYIGKSQQKEAPPSTPTKRPANISLFQQSRESSSNGDDIASQLPSTYSLSDATTKGSGNEPDLPIPSPTFIFPTTPNRMAESYVTVHPIASLAHASQTTCSPAITSHRPTQNHHVPSTSEVPPSTKDQNIQDDPIRGAGAAFQACEIVGRMEQSHSTPNYGTSSRARAVCGHAGLQVTEPVIAMPPPPPPPTLRAANKALGAAPVTPAKPAEILEIQELSRTIEPGPPATSCARFNSHVTPALIGLYNKLDLSSRYKPNHVSRSVRQSERGYWLVQTHSWSVALQIDFWRFLEQWIGSGKAGWGVWCTRDMKDDEEDDDDDGKGQKDSGTQPAGSEPNAGRVKVFCWGEVVQHVYLMLYVASKSKIRKVAPAWIDADGEVIVQI